MAIYTQNDMDRKLMMKIIGDFPPGNYVTPEVAMHRHFGRMVMLVRWTFLRYCERRHCGGISLKDFGHDLKHADIGMWMDEPYMELCKTNGETSILAQYSLETLKALYHYIKGKN